MSVIGDALNALKASVPKQVCTPEAQNVTAFLEMLKYCETRKTGEAAYWVAYGNGKLPTLAKHPGGSQPAGAYQIKGSTWNGYAKIVKVTDFSPKSQDLVCLCIINTWCGALADIKAGRFAEAIRKCAWKVGRRGQWSSLPGSTESKVAMSECVNIYQSNGGMLA